MSSASGSTTVLSETWLTIPARLKSGMEASADKSTYEAFLNGSYSNTVNNPKLAAAIEKYMEKKWPTEDITTVNVRSFIYKNLTKTTFKFEGYYISKKRGTCKYNSCYGNGVNSSGNYSITFFNSMSAEKKISCASASKLKNR